MVRLVIGCFMWLPPLLRVLVGSIVMIFSVLVCIDVVKVLYELLKFILDILGGFFGKVVTIFV